VIDSEAYRQKVLPIVKTQNNVHRLNAWIGTHVLIPAIISNFFFFGGTEFGYEFIRRTYFDGFWTYIKMSSCIALLYPVAEAVKRWEHRAK